MPIPTRIVSWDEIYGRVGRMRTAIPSTAPVYGVPRGGATIAALLGRAVDRPELAEFIVDDVIDSGETARAFREQYPTKPFHALFDKREPEDAGQFLVFPWEMRDESAGPAEAVRRLLQFIGEDADREGLRDTPARVVKSLADLTSGYGRDVKAILERRFSDTYDEMVVVTRIPFWSLCEHHLLPFHGWATVGYIPNGMVVGLSKIPRLVDAFARRLQLQERLTRQIADTMSEQLGALGVGVLVSASHTCMAMRGVGVQAPTVTSALLGVLREAGPREEFLRLAK